MTPSRNRHALAAVFFPVIALGVFYSASTHSPDHYVSSSRIAFDDYPRRPGIDVENYRFEITLTDEDDDIDASATVTVRFTADGITTLPLDLIGADGNTGMRVTSVVDANWNLDFTHESDLLTIELSAPGRTGETARVTINYHGVPRAGLRAGPNKYGDRTFFSDNWPNRARHWLPTIDHPYDKATSEMVVTAPSHYQVVSNGLIVEETDLGNGNRLTHWRQSVPIATWLFVLGVARFAVQHVDDFDGRPIQTWVYPQDRDAGFYDFAVPTKQALEFYDEYVGPFAYEKLANITSPVTGGGMEAATAIMYGENSVTGTRSTRWRNIIIHEVAHQWFGNAVTESDWDDVWLSEGFATYFTLLFIEHAYGKDEFIEGLRSSAEAVFRGYEQTPDYRIVHDDLSDMRQVTSRLTYQKGAWVLHMLRSQMGDEAFWDGIQSYYARFMNRNASTTDFRIAMEEASGLDLDSFFEQWLYTGGNPVLRGTWEYDVGSEAVHIRIEQIQESGPAYDLPLEVEFDLGNGEARVIERLRLTERAQEFTIPIGSPPRTVRLDPETKVLFRADFQLRRR